MLNVIIFKQIFVVSTFDCILVEKNFLSAIPSCSSIVGSSKHYFKYLQDENFSDYKVNQDYTIRSQESVIYKENRIKNKKLTFVAQCQTCWMTKSKHLTKKQNPTNSFQEKKYLFFFISRKSKNFSLKKNLDKKSEKIFIKMD